MCGIFGVVAAPGTLRGRLLRRLADDLFLLSESRGKEAAGLALESGSEIRVYKRPMSASRLIRQAEYRRLLDGAARNGAGSSPLALIGHSRLVTHGAEELHDNNQPVLSGDLVAIHNGIIVNHEELWRAHPELERRHQIDTEVLLGLVGALRARGEPLVAALRQAFGRVEGTAAVALLAADVDALALVTNYGSLYRLSAPGLEIFASERFILERLLEREYLCAALAGGEVSRLEAGAGVVLDLSTLAEEPFSLVAANGSPSALAPARGERRIVDLRPASGEESAARSVVSPGATVAAARVPAGFERHAESVAEAVARLRRCSRCLLPETMPFIDFDASGVCSYCRSYRPIETAGPEALAARLEPYRRPGGEPEVIVTFSGGRDSSYGLAYLVRELGMKPLAYTYDWGMITDLGRRNQARMCGRLGVEHVLVSADIKRKRENVRRNVSAWLRRPHLGTVPLFMAGDKQYFYFANRLRQTTGIEPVVLCENLLETTFFKTGFAGLRPLTGAEHTYTLGALGKLRLAFFYAGQMARNPGYLNRSLLDSAHAFFSYYLIPHDYLNLFAYLRWDEAEISRTLVEEFDWETAHDTSTTWRIGDGTASFYNYIYYAVAGFTENDTFRSNQIREGRLSRSEALERVRDENRPRFDSIAWYCDTIGLDFERALGRIQAIPPLYSNH